MNNIRQHIYNIEIYENQKQDIQALINREKMNLISEIKKARKAKGISQRQMANKIGVSNSFISFFESSKCPIPEIRLKQILKVLE